MGKNGGTTLPIWYKAAKDQWVGLQEGSWQLGTQENSKNRHFENAITCMVLNLTLLYVIVISFFYKP